MNPITVNGELWFVKAVQPTDGRLVDRTGKLALGTTDPITRTIWVSEALEPPMLDAVVLHEAAHAVTVSYGLLNALRKALPEKHWTAAEEWACSLVERYGMEVAALASEALGRGVCVRGYCD